MRLLLLLGCLGLIANPSYAGEFQPNPNAGAGSVIVHGKFGGNIFGFDLDPNGTEGLLSEEVGMADGTIHAAVETFDQTTGEIIAVVSETFTHDDFITLGVGGNSVGLVEREEVLGLFHVKRRFEIINPLHSNTFTGRWTPPLDRKHIINQVKSSQVEGTSEVAVYAIA